MANNRLIGKRIDEATGTETVGHEWDGIEELDTPMPRWWLWTFYLTIFWSLVYVILYPAWPLIERATTGVLGWSSRSELAEEMSLANQAQQSVLEEIAATDLNKLAANPQLFQQAVAGGAAAFRVNCVQCHGSGAAGSQTLGYPNLNDDDWLWGGTMEEIHYSIAHGIRQPADNEERQSIMPSFAGAIEGQQLDALVAHALSLSGKGQANAVGAQLYADNCLVCHGIAGEGSRDIGAPRLNDAIWLRGGTPQDIRAQILNPKMGAMPAWEGRLSPVTIKMLTAYVWSLGGGEQAVPVVSQGVTTPQSEDRSDEQP